MLHHLSFGVSNLERAAAFYDATLSALGYARVWSDATAIGYGVAGGGGKIAIKLRKGGGVPPGPGVYVAFAAASREAVARFSASTVGQRGTDNRAPRLSPQDGGNYY